MSGEMAILVGTAATLGFIHTVLGPDHYLPFIVLSKARKWSMKRTVIITFLCGIGHVLSSVILGFIGIALGITLFKLKTIESIRGELAGWLLLAFGFTYFIWGLRGAIRNRSHQHFHQHEGVETSRSPRTHISKEGLTPWILFIIFLFGPCEPLIPLVMYPAAKGNMLNVAVVASIFGVITIFTMIFIVLISSYGLSRSPLGRLERYSNALAGLIIFFCGVAIKFLGL
jgi:sulfite exporter TauE/SafE